VADAAEPQRVADLLLEALRQPHKIMQQLLTSTPSIGMTTSGVSGGDRAKLLRDADTAMYRAKSDGRNRVVVFEASMHQAAARRTEVEAALRLALREKRLTLHYQPIIAVESGEVVGFEALCRWDDPHLGRVGPGEFIPIAEEAGLIDQLGRQGLERAAGQLAAWRSDGLVGSETYISVNVSKRQLLMPDMIDHLELTVAAADLPRALLKLEITETALGDARTPIKPILVQLRRLGYRLMIDDFGTGTSSLTSLHDVPADVLKIDRGFILQMQRMHSYTAIINAVIQLASNLNLEVIAEGVEEAAQFAQIQALGCHSVQGYLFSAALPPEEVPAFLDTKPGLTPGHLAA
jgi:EAL domain-containing protein (putative c-di-GMP-specific phosphodiesterase class I)